MKAGKAGTTSFLLRNNTTLLLNFTSYFTREIEWDFFSSLFVRVLLMVYGAVCVVGEMENGMEI